MRRSTIACACAVALLAAAPAGAQWQEQFDQYNVGRLAQQSDWEEWDGSFNVDATVVNSRALTPDKCVEVTGQPTGRPMGNDVVYNFANLSGGQPTSGYWIISTRMFVPVGATGTGHFIMLNRYPDRKNWSLQLAFDADNRVVQVNEPSGPDLPLIQNEWVSMVVCIDLDNDRLDVFYGTDLLVENQSWIGSGGDRQIACIDLYGGEPGDPGISSMYYDNMRIERVKGPCIDLVTSPGPVTSGSNVTIDMEAPQSPRGTAALFLWSVNGVPFVTALLVAPLDNDGEFSFTAATPPGLGGLQVGFKAFAVPQGGGILNESNTELMVLE